MSDATQEARNTLRAMFNERSEGRYLFDAYISLDLAGDFACAVLKLMTEREAALREELARCRSGHTNLVDRNALLRQRPDLPADRIPAHEKLMDLQQRLADAERRNAPQWIECKDRMPEPDVDVLVSYTPLGQEKAIVHGAFLNKAFDDMDHLFWFNGKGEAMRGVVSHWLPMIALNPKPEAATSEAACTCWLQPQEPHCTNCPNNTRGRKP